METLCAVEKPSELLNPLTRFTDNLVGLLEQIPVIPCNGLLAGLRHRTRPDQAAPRVLKTALRIPGCVSFRSVSQQVIASRLCHRPPKVPVTKKLSGGDVKFLAIPGYWLLEE